MSTNKYSCIFSRQIAAISFIYSPRRSRVEYSTMFSEPEVNNCSSIIFRGEYQELQSNELKHKNTSYDELFDQSECPVFIFNSEIILIRDTVRKQSMQTSDFRLQTIF